MYLSKIIRILLDYDVCFLAAAFGALWLFGVVNWWRNVYRGQNRKIEKCRAEIFRNPKFTGVYVADLPEEYRRQWRAFVNSEATRPSLVFEFVPRKNKTCATVLLLASAAVTAVYFAIFVADVAYREYAVFMVAFWLAFAVIMMVNALLFGKKERAARQIFGRFVAQLNAVDLNGTAKNNRTLTQELKRAARDCSNAELERVGDLLRQDGLNNDRTVEEQRAINKSLNSLLQAYAGSAGK